MPGRGILIILFVLQNLFSAAQKFYFTHPVVPLDNKTYEQTLPGCVYPEITTCPPTNNIGQYPENEYADLAIDANQNMYWVSHWGSLYRKNLAVGAPCQFLGTFSGTSNVNAMAVDDNGDLYGTGNTLGICYLYKYSNAMQTFSTLGSLPAGFMSCGDLFFYRGQLFLTAQNEAATFSTIMEVNISNPNRSCEIHRFPTFMRLYSAFTTVINGIPKVYFINLQSIVQNNVFSVLHEFDMASHTLSAGLCTYPLAITGAAAIYVSSPPFIASVCATLPVKLTDFRLTIDNNEVRLNWETAGNASYFEIEKSNDNMAFRKIEVVPGSNSQGLSKFSYIDHYPQPENYYRLKMFDKDGSFEYSKILFARLPRNGIFLSQNPVQDVLEIKTGLSSNEKADLNIIDLSGRIIKTVYSISGDQKINISALHDGVYIARLVLKNGSVLTKSFIKQ